MNALVLELGLIAALVALNAAFVGTELADPGSRVTRDALQCAATSAD